jgi:hypothetical protein
MDFLAAENLNDLLAELAQPDAGAGQVRVRGDQAENISLLRRRVPAEQEIRRAQRKKLSAWLCTIWPRFIRRRNLSAAGGMLTAMMASPALADASVWLTGQMPQMRA